MLLYSSIFPISFPTEPLLDQNSCECIGKAHSASALKSVESELHSHPPVPVQLAYPQAPTMHTSSVQLQCPGAQLRASSPCRPWKRATTLTDCRLPLTLGMDPGCAFPKGRSEAAPSLPSGISLAHSRLSGTLLKVQVA